MLKIRAGWGAVVGAGLCLLMATSVLAADEYPLFMGFMKSTQKADMDDSFNRSTGVANVNMAAGNLNNQAAVTNISSGGFGFGGRNYSINQGISGFFIVGNAVYGWGEFAQRVIKVNNRVLVSQQTVGFLVDARNTLGVAAISHSFQGFSGVATFNQAVGNLNNQVTLSTLDVGSGQGLSAIHSGSPLRVYSDIRDNKLLLNSDSSYKAVIDGGSFRNFHGMLAVSQTAGNLNNTVNYVGLSVNTAPEESLGLSNSTLANVTALNKKNKNVIDGQGACPEVSIEHGAFKNFSGVASITQVAGNVNQVVSQVGVSVH